MRQLPYTDAPRSTSHRGSVLASGFWIAGVAEEAATRLVLGLWQSGAEVRRVSDGYVILLGRPQRVAAELGSAAALVSLGTCWSSAPLRPRELQALPARTLCLVSGGVRQTLALDQLDKVDPASWLDVSVFTLLSGESLGETAKPADALSKPAEPDVMFDASVGRSADDKSRQAELLQALQRVAGGHGAERPSTSALGKRVLGAAVNLLRQLGTLFALRRRASPASRQADSSLARTSPRAPSRWQRLKAALAGWLANTRLATFLGRKHAEYLRNLFELLDQQDDDEVLRRAIPLNKSKGEPGPPALMPFSARTSFAISLGPKTASRSLGLVTDLFEQLRRSYEAVFQRLDAAGKHEQAAYFLAEILDEPERAVAYLERHGERVLAARLAEARQLAPGLVVRQWFLAGDRQRAILIAVREGAFNAAIARLEQAGNKEEAAALRLLQAERLASAGLLVRAAELVHHLESGKALALRWLELAREAGDVRGIPLELRLDATRFDAAQAALTPLLEQAEEQLPTLLYVAEELAAHNLEIGKPLARDLARELLSIAASTGMARVATSANRVASYVGGAFKADQPRPTTFERRIGGGCRRYEFPANDAGTAPVYDLHRFGTHVLSALGEAGVVMLNRQGKRVAHFGLPAHALVVAPDSGRVLCVAKRGDRLAVGRIDLSTRRSEPWCELEAKSFARQFDGETWLACTSRWGQSQDSELLQLDVLDDQPRVLRRLPVPIEGPTIHLDGTHVNLVGPQPFTCIERLRYELPQLTLRERKELLAFPPLDPDNPRTFIGTAAARGDKPAAMFLRWSDTPASTLSRGDHTIKLPSDDLEGVPQLALHGDFYALSLSNAARVRVFVGSFAAPEPHVEVVLHGATHTALRFYDDALFISDERGRLVGIDPLAGAPFYDVRI